MHAVIELSLPSVSVAVSGDVQDGSPFRWISFTVMFLQVFDYIFQTGSKMRSLLLTRIDRTVGLLNDSLVSLLTSISINGNEDFLSMTLVFFIFWWIMLRNKFIFPIGRNHKRIIHVSARTC
jgi:hypothetical protein